LTKKREGFEVFYGNENIFNITTFSNSLGHNMYLSGKLKNACQILMENLERTENFFGNNDIKQKILWNGILRKINRLNSTGLREK
jgi:hypothetical protein